MFTLRQAQYDGIEAAQAQLFMADLVASLREEGEAFAGVHPLIVHSLCSNAIERARTLGLGQPADAALFVRLMARVSPTFDLNAEIHGWLMRTDIPPDERLARAVDEGDELCWTLASEDDSSLGWYLRSDTFERPLAERLSLALGEALNPDDLPPEPQRTAQVEAALEAAARAGFESPEAQWLWCACTMAYGAGFAGSAAWAPDVFDAGLALADQIGLLKVRLALDFAAWL